ncbi:hypothetical protein LCGC14_2375220 [marine sediment metagenome]|uniref:MerC mercury resistance protein n=1 Tax=marine sediment metagenome TaxID=412755 RepID=A0A0F9CPU3_9ZZZZ
MSNSKLDKIGMVLSVGCAVHCVLVPIVLPLLPMIGFVFGHDSHFHLILAAIITGVACLALVPGYFKHRIGTPMISACIGVVIIITMGVMEHYIESVMIITTTIMGSLFVMLGHFYNHKFVCECKNHKGHSCL